MEHSPTYWGVTGLTRLSPVSLCAFNAALQTSRVLSHPLKIMVLWEQRAGQPEVVGSLTFHHTLLDQTGLSVGAALVYGGESKAIKITNELQELIPGRLFSLIPESAWPEPGTEYGVKVCKTPVVFRSEGTDKTARIKENTLCITQMSEFRTTYLEHKGLKL